MKVRWPNKGWSRERMNVGLRTWQKEMMAADRSSVTCHFEDERRIPTPQVDLVMGIDRAEKSLIRKILDKIGL